MKNYHLFPAISTFCFFVILAVFTTTQITVSPLMITVIVASFFISGIYFHYKKSQLNQAKTLELALIAVLVQAIALSFL
jgi:hypothetical protein